jgi:hypothetical protein
LSEKKMNKQQFLQWLETHFPAHKFTSPRLMAFLEIYGQLAKPLSIKAAQAWLSRNKIPEKVVLLLPKIAERVAQPVTLHHFSVSIALNDEELAALQSTAAKACSTPAQFLPICLRIGFESECGIE